MNKIFFSLVLLSLLSVALGVCNYNLCVKPRCSFGQKPTLHSGQCCPTCSPRGKKNCSKFIFNRLNLVCNVACVQPTCATGFHAAQTDYACCPLCVSDQTGDCTVANCVVPSCIQGYGLVVDKTVSCCPFCAPLL